MHNKTTNLEILYARYRKVHDTRPAAIGTTFFFGPVGWVARILGSLLFMAGAGLILAALIQSPISQLQVWVTTYSSVPINPETFLIIQSLAGAMIALPGTFLYWGGMLCRRIVRRNFYILDLEELFDEHVANAPEEEVKENVNETNNKKTIK